MDRLEAGVVLTGAEVKSVKQKRISLGEAYVKLISGEAWLVNAHIAPYQFAANKDYDPTRSRKLLLSRKELLSLSQKMEQKKLVLVPTAAYTKRGRVKIEIALARSKKTWQKKEAKKRKDLDREAERIVKNS